MGISTLAEQAWQATAAQVNQQLIRLRGSGPDKKWSFRREPMVSWFHPRTLFNAAIRALLTTVIGRYGDRRDSQATLGSADLLDTEAKELWVDFVADSGDGFASTFTVARVLAEQELEHDSTKLQRAQLILFGGDQVYPDAHDNAYANRFVGPWNAAFEHVADADLPCAFAIPGNHDWYDGLGEFLSMFCGSCDDNAFERIRTPQQRSYWGLKLTKDWICFGVDWHIGVTMDLGQREYFDELLSKISTRTNVMLVVPNPVWLQFFRDGEEEYAELERFVEQIEGSGHCHVKVVLTGDLHCYARYEYSDSTVDKRQLIMAGGGGAYLYPTHALPRVGRGAVNTDPLAMETKRYSGTLNAVTAYPEPAESVRLAKPAWKLPSLNSALIFLLVGPAYLVLNYVLRSADQKAEGTLAWSVWRNAEFCWTSYWESLWLFVESMYSMLGLLTVILIVVATSAWSLASRAVSSDNWRFRGVFAATVGALHGIGHIVLACTSVWFIAALRLITPDTLLLIIEIVFLLAVGLIAKAYFRSEPVAWSVLGLQVLAVVGLVFAFTLSPDQGVLEDRLRIPIYSEEVIVIGGFLGTFLLGLYLRFANFFGGHSNDVLACQARADYKNFLRMYIDKNGQLTIYPFGVDASMEEDQWEHGAGGWTPKGKRTVESLARDIEAPIVIT